MHTQFTYPCYKRIDFLPFTRERPSTFAASPVAHNAKDLMHASFEKQFAQSCMDISNMLVARKLCSGSSGKVKESFEPSSTVSVANANEPFLTSWWPYLYKMEIPAWPLPKSVYLTSLPEFNEICPDTEEHALKLLENAFPLFPAIRVQRTAPYTFKLWISV